VAALPATAETVAAYLASEAEAGAKPSTIGRRCAAIRFAHKLAGLEAPTDAEAVKATMRGIRRTLGVARSRKAPVTSELVRAMAALAAPDAKGLRDRALLLFGFAGAFRRSELVALDVEDLRETEGGLLVTIRRSKTDQEGQGRTIAIARGSLACPVRAVRNWLDAAAINAGPVFRPVAKGGRIGADRLSDKQVARTAKNFAQRLGLEVSDFSGHSLRAGFLTSAAANGASIFKMRDVSGHKNMDTLQGYVRSAELFQHHAGAGLL
jgi:site-specific recombinase XerD